MRTVNGATDRIVIVGAGLAGLSAAMHLVGRSREVTVLERDPGPGGRAGYADLAGYRLDTGPTVLTMPDLVESVFAAAGARAADRLRLLPVEPAYRAHFADGRTLEVHADAERMQEEIRRFAGAAHADGYRRLRDWLTRLYRAEMDRFIATNFDSPLSMLNPALARLVALGGFGRWDRAVARYIRDPDLRRVFTFQSLYAGVAPTRALAAYAVIAYMDTIGGVFFPQGGMRALPESMAGAASDAGVRFRYGTTVTALERAGSRITGVITQDGIRIPCDAVVLTTELHEAYRLIARTPRRPVPLTSAPSAVIAHLVLAGGSTVPGVGIPPVLISGRLAADRVTGLRPARHRRAVPVRTALTTARIERRL